jgi:hypothetical protein
MSGQAMVAGLDGMRWEAERMSSDIHHSHSHQHDDEGQEIPCAATLRVKALQSLLVEKGPIDPAALDVIVDACLGGAIGPGRRQTDRQPTPP